MVIKEKTRVRKEVPICEKAYLTVNEAAAYFNLGRNCIRTIIETSEAVLWIGQKRLINRQQFAEELKTLQIINRKEKPNGNKKKKGK